MLLSKEDVRQAGGIVHSDGNVFFTNLDQLNAALLAKLGAMELPKPLSMGSSVAGVFLDVYLPVHLQQAYAQGAAAQLAENPSAYELSATKYANGRELVYTVPDALASYIKVEPLYTRREAK